MASIQLSNGQKMPLVGLGTWQASFKTGECPEADKEVEDAIHHAVAEVGYRQIDTAYVYAVEKPIGRALQKLYQSSVVRREDMFLVTKLPQIGMTPSKVEHFLKLSLAALQADYVDLYLIHIPYGVNYVDDETSSPMTPEGVLDVDFASDLLAVWKAMEAQVDAGRAKAIGLSNVDVEQVERVLKNCRIKPANVQCEASVFFQNRELRECCAKNGISFTAFSPLGSPGSLAVQEIVGTATQPNILTNETILKMATKYGKSPAQIALKFLVQQDVAVLPKSSNPKRLRENFEVQDFEISAEDMEVLKGLEQGAAARVFAFAKWCNSVYAKHPECRF